MPRSGSTRKSLRSAFVADGPPLGFLLTSVGFARAFGFRKVIEPFGLHPQEFAVLRQIAADEGISQQACGAALKVAPSRMVALVDELERKGLVERRPNPSDRRARALFVTDEGRRVLGQAFEAIGRNEAEVFASLSAAERNELRRLLLAVSASMGLEPGTHAGMHFD